MYGEERMTEKGATTMATARIRRNLGKQTYEVQLLPELANSIVLTTDVMLVRNVIGNDGYDALLACMAGHKQSHVSLVAVATFFRAESLSRSANGDFVLDAQTLYTLAAPTLDAPLQ
ncbi:hypothetical protein H310_15183 [Aphanomyces invadans]|uniref:Uncharacterized protein n=1 Tax=Aphanomyces invadans TaxID=157072 RepID=A0A024T7N9_9STRA|nr:hypothetical protein H310_15183 [Aphanomyces invadans]ETV89975.1 hypothetical protein H310_15183 [Aphanomyces invadans]|eukprot:XP_008881391.1 hypothetical protein H310_15183 [Aphanomyces invadans]